MRLLQNDHLDEFESVEQTLNSTQLLSLLRHQSKLRSFRARLELSDLATEDIATWTSEHGFLFNSNLRLLKTLRICIRQESPRTEHDRALELDEMTCSGQLLKAAPFLESLEICGWRKTWYHELQRLSRIGLEPFFKIAANPKQFPRTLRSLTLVDMFLPQGHHSNSLLNAIDVTVLHSLKLEGCDGYTAFLYMLARLINQKATQLKVLTVRTKHKESLNENLDDFQVVNDVLDTFEGLEELELEFLRACFTKASYGGSHLSHHQTLKKLLLASDLTGRENNRRFNVGNVLSACPRLQYFAYIPPVLYNPLSIEDPEEMVSLPNGLYNSLDTIAASPTLRTLHMMYVPVLQGFLQRRGDPACIEKAIRILYRYATLALTHLYQKGSGIRFLYLSPNQGIGITSVHTNKYRSPVYFYQLVEDETDVDGGMRVVRIQEDEVEYPYVYSLSRAES